MSMFLIIKKSDLEYIQKIQVGQIQKENNRMGIKKSIEDRVKSINNNFTIFVLK